MGAVIKVNGMEVPESLAIIDTANNTVTLQTMLISEQELDVDKIHVDVDKIHAEVNLFGEIEL